MVFRIHRVHVITINCYAIGVTSEIVVTGGWYKRSDAVVYFCNRIIVGGITARQVP